MSNKPPIRVDYAILCDDIRQEANGKLILIGIYTGDILISEFPAKLSLCILLHGRAGTGSSVTMEIRYRAKFEDAETYEITARGEMNMTGTEESNEFYVPLPRMPIEIRNEGVLSIDYRIDDNRRWKSLFNKNIRASGS